MADKEKNVSFYGLGQDFYDIAFEAIAKKAKEIEETHGYMARLSFEVGAASRISQYGDMFIDLGKDKTELNTTIERNSINKISEFDTDNKDTIDYDGMPLKKQLF